MKGLIVAAALLQATGSMRVLARGSQSFIDARKEVVARSQAELDAVWKMHAPNHTPPAVDFDREMVVGLFVGSKNTAGYSVEIADVAQGPNALVVRYREQEPAKSAIVAQVITSPYFLVAVPTYPGDVRFEKIQ